MSESSREKFRAHFDIPAERFTEAMLQRILFRGTRWRHRFATNAAAAADRCFSSSVGRLTRRTDFPGEVEEYRRDSRTRSFCCHTLPFRVSALRLKKLLREVAPEPRAVPAAERLPAGSLRSLGRGE